MSGFLETLSSLISSNAFAQAQGGSASAQSPSFSFFVPLILVFVIFYFLMIRPQKKQQQVRMKMLSELKKGDEVVTLAGIHGKITGVADKILTVEIADNLKIKIDREAIARIKQETGDRSQKTE